MPQRDPQAYPSMSGGQQMQALLSSPVHVQPLQAIPSRQAKRLTRRKVRAIDSIGALATGVEAFWLWNLWKRLSSGLGDLWKNLNAIADYIYAGQNGPIYSVAWSPDSNLIAFGGTQKTVFVWNVTNGQILSTYRGHTGAISGLVWSPDGGRGQIASASADGSVQIWKAADGV